MLLVLDMAIKGKITFLGTASAIPTAKRNHTGILLDYGNEHILFDCGEGIQRQFKIGRRNVCKLTRVLISHWHGDHTLGLPGLFETLAMNGYGKTLKIYGPRGTKRKISLFEEIYGRFKIDYEVYEVSGKFIDEKDFFIEAEKMIHGPPTNAYAFVVKDKRRLDKSKIKKFKIPNSPLLGRLQEGKDIVVDGKKVKSKDVSYLEKGKKFCVILDTAMNPTAVKLAKGSGVLVCESSFLNDEREKAKEYKHLTATDAAKIAKKANVGKLFLTHISQRHEKDLKVLEKEAKKIFLKSEVSKEFGVVDF